ncbi:MAG: LysE family transporter [Pseudomonadota bacterium]
MMPPLITFLALAMFSPGPNVIMLTASGARFGVRATGPHLAGVVLGVGVIGAVSGLGIGALLNSRHDLRLALQVIAAVWILFMAWQLASAQSAESETDPTAHPMAFHAAVLFQWVNPKIWAIALAASSAHGAGLPPLEEALRMGTNFSAVNFFVCVFWTCSGALLALLLGSPRAWLAFRLTMAFFLALSAALVFV